MRTQRSRAKIPVAVRTIERAVIGLRGQNVMLDRDLAMLYGVETKALVRAVKRNLERFPPDFMIQLSSDEFQSLRSHFGASKARGGTRYRPYAFTEQGVAMLSSALRSPRAVHVNVEIMRTFVRLRRVVQLNADLARRLDRLERKYDGKFQVVFEAIRELMVAPLPAKKRIGFRADSLALARRPNP